MNTKQTHTPGPWIHAHSGPVMQGYSQPFAIAQKGERNLVAGVFGDVKGGVDVTEANARLIAAAPELLEALKTVVDGVVMIFPSIVNSSPIIAARAAIAKAEGT